MYFSNRRVWETGEQIIQQDIWNGRLLVARPVTVVEDNISHLALYTHPGAPYRSASMQNRSTLPVSERVGAYMSDELPPFEERRSGNRHVLTLTPPDTGHSVWLFWTLDWQLQSWYINLQSPIQRTTSGLLVQDQVLDIVVRPDMTWSWKDEDEFSELHRQGFFTDEQAASIRAEGERMVRVLENNEPPFCDGWEGWRPDPEWPVPQVPAGWDILPEDANL